MTPASALRAPGRKRARLRAAQPAPSRPPDGVLLGVVAALVAFGLAMVFSASSATAYAAFHDSTYYFKRQLVWLALAIVPVWLAYRVDYRKLKTIAPGLVIVTAVLLVVTLVPHVGLMSGGARRWVGVGAVSFQPSELAKLALVVFLAAKLSSLGEGVRSLTKGVVPVLLVTMVLAVPILLEPDMGTASLLVFTAFATLFCAGARFEHLFLAATAMLPTIALVVGASPYKRARVLAFLDPWKDAQNTGFHIVQSLLALGSGGALGLGLGASRQKYFYLPEAHTDFIFAVLGEELGLIGTLAVLALFVVFAWRATRIALHAPDAFGRLLVLGATAAIVIQAFVNIGVVTSSWPVTGVPLPFISFGGTSLAVSLVFVALIANVGRFGRSPGR